MSFSGGLRGNVEMLELLQRAITTKGNTFTKLKSWRMMESDISRLVALQSYEEQLRKTSSDDSSLADLAQAELTKVKSSQLENLQNIKNMVINDLSPHKPSSSSIMEIRAGCGGEEAELFASEMYEMYKKYSALRGWDITPIDSEYHFAATPGQPIKEARLRIDGDNCLGHLLAEAGVHRVQRIPSTDPQRRIHTSTVTVAVLPPIDDKQTISVAEKDLQITFIKSSGPGGQHVNKTNSAVRIVHIPTGIAVSVREERSAETNKQRGIQYIREKLASQAMEKSLSEVKTSRDSQVKTAHRSEKIRTYNYPQDRITDHRIGKHYHGIRSFMEGTDLLDISTNFIESQEYQLLTSFLGATSEQ